MPCSYEACGFLDTNAPIGFISELRSLDQGTLRVTYPGNDVYRLWRDGEGGIKGLFPDIANEAVSLMRHYMVTKEGTPIGLNVTRVPISENANTLVREEFGYSSSYTGDSPRGRLQSVGLCWGRICCVCAQPDDY